MPKRGLSVLLKLASIFDMLTQKLDPYWQNP